MDIRNKECGGCRKKDRRDGWRDACGGQRKWGRVKKGGRNRGLYIRRI